MAIKVQGLRINEYNLFFNISDNEVFGVYCKDNNLVSKLFCYISGINNNHKTCFTCPEKELVKETDVDVFDNEEYFRRRIFLDFKNEYLKTLNTDSLEESLNNRFNLSFNKERFNKLINDLNVRRESIYTYTREFNNVGNTLANFCFLKGVSTNKNKKEIIINNPTIYLDDKVLLNKKRKEVIVKEMCNKNDFNLIVLGLNFPSDFLNLLDKVLILTDYNTSYVINPNIDSLIVIDDNINLKDKLFKITNSSQVITLNSYSKEDLRVFKKNKIKYNIISFYDITKYLNINDGNYNEDEEK